MTYFVWAAMGGVHGGAMGLVDVVDGIFVSFALGDRPHTKAYVFAINRINHPASTIILNHWTYYNGFFTVGNGSEDMEQGS